MLNKKRDAEFAQDARPHNPTLVIRVDFEAAKDDQAVGKLRRLIADELGLDAARPTRIFACPGLAPTCLTFRRNGVEKIATLSIAHHDGPTPDIVPTPAAANVQAALAKVERGPLAVQPVLDLAQLSKAWSETDAHRQEAALPNRPSRVERRSIGRPR